MMLIETRREYRLGNIEKHKYIQEMFNTHQFLFEYPVFIKDSPITKIEISKEQVIFTINNDDAPIKICCDAKDAYSLPMIFLNLSESETDERAMALKLINPGDVVFDIGANIGWYTINILLERKGTLVYSFEPIESSYQLLRKNLALNNLSPKNAWNIGFSDEDKTTKFYFDVNFAMASSMANLREDEDTVMVDCEAKKIDTFVSTGLSLERLDFIKCDVEGAEFLVFQGGYETIKKHKPIIFAEMLRKWAAKFNYHPNQTINFLKDLGYQCFIIHNHRQLKEFFEMDENTIETNFFFLHKEKHKSLVDEI